MADPDENEAQITIAQFKKSAYHKFIRHDSWRAGAILIMLVVLDVALGYPAYLDRTARYFLALLVAL